MRKQSRTGTATKREARPAKPQSGAQLLEKFERGLDEELRAQWTRYRGREYLTLRLYWKPDAPLPGKTLPPDGYLPTKRGVTIRPGELRALADAIKEAQRIAEE